jgi:Skp family chaperone for outer membrane proteins
MKFATVLISVLATGLIAQAQGQGSAPITAPAAATQAPEGKVVEKKVEGVTEKKNKVSRKRRSKKEDKKVEPQKEKSIETEQKKVEEKPK